MSESKSVKNAQPNPCLECRNRRPCGAPCIARLDFEDEMGDNDFYGENQPRGIVDPRELVDMSSVEKICSDSWKGLKGAQFTPVSVKADRFYGKKEDSLQ